MIVDNQCLIDEIKVTIIIKELRKQPIVFNTCKTCIINFTFLSYTVPMEECQMSIKKWYEDKANTTDLDRLYYAFIYIKRVDFANGKDMQKSTSK